MTITIENITNPGQPLTHMDQYKKVNDIGTFTLHRHFTGTTTLTPEPIRTITTQAFFRRLTTAERKVLRNSALDPVADLREDLQRSSTINLDGTIEQQLLDTTLLNQTRIDQLLVDGTNEEV